LLGFNKHKLCFRALPDAVRRSRDENVLSFAVGVGNEINLSELELIAGAAERVITVENFGALYTTVGRLQDDIRILEGALLILERLLDRKTDCYKFFNTFF